MVHFHTACTQCIHIGFPTTRNPQFEKSWLSAVRACKSYMAKDYTYCSKRRVKSQGAPAKSWCNKIAPPTEPSLSLGSWPMLHFASRSHRGLSSAPGARKDPHTAVYTYSLSEPPELRAPKALRPRGCIMNSLITYQEAASDLITTMHQPSHSRSSHTHTHTRLSIYMHACAR